jgi:hypothetical protein
MSKLSEYLERFFFVFLKGRTYLNMLYLFLSFPLGIIYFVILITGFAVGIPLIIIWVGLLILLGVFALWYAFVVFERKLAIWLLKVEISPINTPDFKAKNLWSKFKTAAGNPVTWKGLAFLFVKFPLGTFNFSILITLLALSLSTLTAPLYYRWFQPQVNLIWTTTPMHWTVVDTLPEALIMSLVGIFILLISMHIFNGMAFISGKFAEVMLGNRSAGTAIVESAPVVLPDQTDLSAS